MNTYAVVDSSGTIVNVVVWDGANDWAPPEDCTAVPISTAPGGPGIGWTTSDGGQTWTAPPSP